MGTTIFVYLIHILDVIFENLRWKIKIEI